MSRFIYSELAQGHIYFILTFTCINFDANNVIDAHVKYRKLHQIRCFDLQWRIQKAKAPNPSF